MARNRIELTPEDNKRLDEFVPMSRDDIAKLSPEDRKKMLSELPGLADIAYSALEDAKEKNVDIAKENTVEME